MLGDGVTHRGEVYRRTSDRAEGAGLLLDIDSTSEAVVRSDAEARCGNFHG